jgi:hypothetical protein
MNLRPDHLFLQSATLLYFCSWLWPGVLTAALPVRPFAQRQIGSALIVAREASDMVAWFPVLIGKYSLLCILMVGLAIYVLAVCQPKVGNYLRTVCGVFLALAATYFVIMFVTYLVAI